MFKLYVMLLHILRLMRNMIWAKGSDQVVIFSLSLGGNGDVSSIFTQPTVKTECALFEGEVPVYLQGTANGPLRKALKLVLLTAPVCVAALSF